MDGRSFPAEPAISIHALREEGDKMTHGDIQDVDLFLSTPSARRATEAEPADAEADDISIHALREEGDFTRTRESAGLTKNFYPRPPRGGRLKVPCFTETKRNISIHALREEGDGLPAAAPAMHRNFYPRPPRGGRQQKRRKTSPLLFHYKTICTDLEELVQKHPKKQL